MMTEEQNQIRRNRMLNLIRTNAWLQTPEARENYFKSCEKHGGELAELVGLIRAEFGVDFVI